MGGPQAGGGHLPVVLIHLGSRPPRFIETCVKQVASVSGYNPTVVGPRTGARYRNTKLDRFRSSERLSKLGLRGFWRYTCERLFVLEEHMLGLGVDRCLHIESDVLLYMPPAEYDEWLNLRYGSAVAVCPLTDTEDTAAIMYVGSRASLSRFNDALLDLVELGPERLLETYGGEMANEMRMLYLLREQGLAEALPTTIPDGEALEAPCLFDPASYGQWVGGTHSKPGIAWAGSHHAIGREFIADRYEVVWDAWRRPSARLVDHPDATLWRLANLHIHSKRLRTWAWAKS